MPDVNLQRQGLRNDIRGGVIGTILLIIVILVLVAIAVMALTRSNSEDAVDTNTTQQGAQPRNEQDADNALPSVSNPNPSGPGSEADTDAGTDGSTVNP